MPAGSFRGRPAPAPVAKKICKKCGPRTGKAAVAGKDFCKGCIQFSPEVRNSKTPPHPRQH